MRDKTRAVLYFLTMSLFLMARSSFAQVDYDGVRQESVGPSVGGIGSSARGIGKAIAAEREEAGKTEKRVTLLEGTEIRKVEPASGQKYGEPSVKSLGEIQSCEECSWSTRGVVREQVEYSCLRLNLVVPATSGSSYRQIIFAYALGGNQRRAASMRKFLETSKDGRYQLVLPELAATTWHNVNTKWGSFDMPFTDHPVSHAAYTGQSNVSDNDYYAHQMKVLDTHTNTLHAIEGFLDRWSK